MRRSLTFIWDIDTGACQVDKIGSGDLWLKRGENVDLTLRVREAGEFTLLPANWTLTLTLKPDGQFDGDPLLQVTDWTEDSSALTYTAIGLVESTQIDDLLVSDSDDSNDLTEAPCALDILYHDPGTGYDAYTDSLAVTLKNNVGRDTDGTPTSTAAADVVLERDGE